MATEETPYLAEKAATWERPVGSDPRDDRIPPEPTPELADQDLVVERADLGPDAGTFVAKGDPIPPELAGLPRRPASGGPRRKR